MLGIDVHGSKGPVDWKLVRKAGVVFAFVKASEGATYVDSRVGRNVRDAAAAGIVVGVYHYARPDNRPSVAGAIVEADHFCDVIEGIYDPEAHGRPVLDIEVGSGNLSDWAFAWCQHVEKRLGVKPIIYSYTYFIRSRLTDKKLAAYSLWLANYGPNDGARHKIPAGEGPWQNWIIHQYTSNGRTPGVSGRCDLNYSPLELDALRGKIKKVEPLKPRWEPGRPKDAPKHIPKWVWEFIKWRKNRKKVYDEL